MAFNPILPCELCEVVEIVKAFDKLIIGLTIFDQEGNEITETPENGIVDVQIKTFGFEVGEQVTVEISLSDDVKATLEGTVDTNNTVVIKNVDLNDYLKSE